MNNLLHQLGIFTEHDVHVAKYMWKGIYQYFSNDLPIISSHNVTVQTKDNTRNKPVLGSVIYPYTNLDDSLQAMKEGRFGCNGNVVGMNALSSAELNKHVDGWSSRDSGYTMEVSFKDGVYNVVELEEDIYMYRAGQKNRTMGQFFARNPPTKRFDVRFNSAVLTEWSALDRVYRVKIPKRTILYHGYIAPQGNANMGLGIQIFIRSPWKIPGLEETAIVTDRWGGNPRSMGTLEAVV